MRNIIRTTAIAFAFFCAAGESIAQTTHYVQTNCNYNPRINDNVDIQVQAGDTVVVTLIAHTNTDWQNSYIEQNGCGWIVFPNVANPLTVNTSNPNPYENPPQSGNIQLIQTGVNSTFTFTVGELTGRTMYASARRWTRQDINGATAQFLYLSPIPNLAPTANAGQNQTVTTQTTVNLNGSGSTDPDGDPLSYQWSQTAGTTVSLTNATTATPTFTAPTLAINAPDSVLTFQLVVNDGTVDSSPATVNVTVQSIKNAAPTVSSVPTSISVVEDTSSNVDLSAATFADTDVGDTLTVTLTASAGTLTATSGGGVTIGGSGTGTLTLSGSPSSINTYLDTASNIQYTTPTDGTGPYTLSVSASDGIADLASNPSVTINVTATPDVTGVSASTADGHYNAGDTVVVEVSFDIPVTVSGTPTLTLETGTVDRTATYTGGDTTNTLSFEYVVQAGDTAADLDYVSTTVLSGTITGNGYAADLTLPSPGAAGSLAANKAIVIDTMAPVVTDAGISILGATGTGGAFKVGDRVRAEWNTAGSNGDINITGSLGSVTVDFSAFGGGSAVAASLSGSVWTATYTIVANTSTSGANLNVAVTATDEAGNTTTATDTGGATTDANPPVVSAANISLSGATGTGGTFKIGDTVTATWDDTASGDNNGDIASVSIDFTEFGGGAVAATNSSGTWRATYTITSGLIDLGNRNVSVTAIDTAGNSSNQTGTNNAVADNIAPTVVDADIAVSGGTGPSGAFKVGDTVSVEWTANNTDTIDTVEVDFSAFGGPAAATATESGGVWTATYVLTAGSLLSSSLQVSVTAYDDAANPVSTTKATLYAANTVVPTVVVTGPTEIVTEQFTVNIIFSEAVSSDLIASELRVDNGTVASVAAVSGSSTEFTAAIDPVLGNNVLVQVLAGAVTNTAGGNPNTASNEFTVFAGSVATAFDEYREEIQQVLLDEATRSLRSTLSANQRMTQGARNRFVADQRQRDACAEEEDPASVDVPNCEIEPVSRNNVPFDVDGSFDMSATTVSTSGSFFEQTGNTEGTYRRLFFGDFDIQHDADTDSTTATLSARVAWEQMASDTTMLGYFVGGELASSNISGAFEGDQDRVAVTAGGYAVHQLADQVYFDGFLSYGIGRNNLEMANDVLALTSDYTTRTATAGAALSGVYEYEQYEFRPELAFSYGKTWIGNVGFTGRAYGLVDDTLSLDAGTVSIANLTLRPEVVWALDADTVAESNSQLSFAPRAICERTIAITRTEHCGGGAELGLSSTSDDGLSTAEFRVVVDRVGSSNRSNYQFNIEHRF